MSNSTFPPDQARRLGEARRRGELPPCPACGAALSTRAVDPREGVPYVRRREWILCTGCRRSLVLDRARPEPGGPPGATEDGGPTG